MAFLTSPLDAAVGSTSKVRLLRLLVEQDRTVSAREAARLTRTSRTAILAAIEDLAKIGLVHREESGRQFLCRANREHKLLQMAFQPLFAAESTWPSIFFDAVREALGVSRKSTGQESRERKSEVLASWVFGSVAAGRDKPGSDVDLFILTETDEAVQPVLEKIAERLSIWRKEFGADVRPIVMSRAKVARQLKAGNKFLKGALRYTRVIAGDIPKELLIGKADNDPKDR